MMSEMLKETLETLSRKTGYSVSTISRVLSGKAETYRISSTAVKRIQEEANKSNFVPSQIGKSLRTNKTNSIGLLIPGIDNHYFSNLAHVIIQEAKINGYMTILIDAMDDEKNERDGIYSLSSRKVDGMIIVPSGTDSSLLDKINKSTPVMLIDRYYEKSSTLSYVCTNNYQGASMATKYLIDKGHKKIACIQGPILSSVVKERVRGYLDVMRENQLEEFTCISGDSFTVENGYLETKLMINSTIMPTAIFSFSNTILLGIIKAIRESELRIPEDISIISFDDSVYMDYLSPSITRISQPVNEIGVLATKILLKKINQGAIPDSKIQLPPKLIIGNSVKQL